MVYLISDNITSPLGPSTEANYQAARSGRTALTLCEHHPYLPEPFRAALFAPEQRAALAAEGLSWFESLALRSAERALADADIDPTGPDVLFVLSTTKGNTGNTPTAGPDAAAGRTPGESARLIASRLGITTTPVVVSNACISGLSAIILAARLLESRQYAHAVVCGADVLGPFIVSGFQSLKALSAEACRPFDLERTGLNLGEAAATVVLSVAQPNPHVCAPKTRGLDPLNHTFATAKPAVCPTRLWTVGRGAVRNDAFHISAPAKKADGATLALRAVLAGRHADELATLNAHGTATLFNDQMESVAIEQAGLSAVPVNALKGCFGHTLGAAGILETVLTLRSVDEGRLLGTQGFDERGVSGRMTMATHGQPTTKHAFVKMISGFGGCNAALWVEKMPTGGPENATAPATRQPADTLRRLHHVLITPRQAVVDGTPLPCQGEGKALLTDLYHRYVADYPKFYKMDGLSRLGFLAAELLVRAEKAATQGATTPPADRRNDDRAIVLFNRTSTTHTDQTYTETIASADEYFPSPSLFVYTLPNIVTGEIAIRNGYHGETSFYVLPHRDEPLMQLVQQATLTDEATRSLLSGWLDFEDNEHFTADLCIMQ